MYLMIISLYSVNLENYHNFKKHASAYTYVVGTDCDVSGGGKDLFYNPY